MKQLKDICGLGTGAGLQGWNCRHEYYLFFPGSKRQYSDKWLKEQNAKEAVKKAFRGKEYNTYEATQKQRQMETAMRAQRENVRLLQQGGADPDDIVIEKCKYQAQLDEYKAFSKKMGMKTQTERIYEDLRGRVAPSKKTTSQYTPEMLKNAVRDSEMYSRRKKMLGDDMPTLKEYRQMKYKNPSNLEPLERQYKTFKEISSKEWSEEFKEKAKSAYRTFKAAGFETSAHFLSRAPRKEGDLQGIIDIMKKVPNYKEVDGREVRWYNEYALIKNPDTNEFVTMVHRKNAKAEWVQV